MVAARSVSKVAQGGAYLLFIFSLANISYVSLPSSARLVTVACIDC